MSYVEEVITLSKGQNQQSRILMYHEAQDLMDQMAAFAGIKPTEFTTVHLVVLKPGQTIGEHRHIEDVVMFYAEPTDTPIIIKNKPILPRPGEMMVVMAETPHSVPVNATKKTRVSVAMKVPHGRIDPT
jgi:quercetin dioxygenase-like cupin family protein